MKMNMSEETKQLRAAGIMFLRYTDTYKYRHGETRITVEVRLGNLSKAKEILTNLGFYQSKRSSNNRFFKWQQTKRRCAA